MEKARITVLVENTAESPGLLAEHGLAFWIEVGSQCILFDTGQGGVLVINAYRLGISLSRVDAVVLSHGHYDHTGGLADALRANRPAAVYAHPAAMKPKFARNKDGTSREIGVPVACEQAIERRRGQFVLTEEPTPVSSVLMATGPVPRVTEFEDTGAWSVHPVSCGNPGRFRPFDPFYSRSLVMMRKSFLVFGLLAIVCVLGANAAQGCCGWWAVRPSYYVASPCYCYVPICSWTCCDPCCGWSCCYYSYPACWYYSVSCPTCRYYRVVPSHGVPGCPSCGPAVPSPSGASLKPVPEKGAAPQNK